MGDTTVVSCMVRNFQIPFNSVSEFYVPFDKEHNANFIASAITFEKKRVKACGFTTVGHILESLGYEWPAQVGGEIITDILSYVYNPDSSVITLHLITKFRIKGARK